MHTTLAEASTATARMERPLSDQRSSPRSQPRTWLSPSAEYFARLEHFVRTARNTDLLKQYVDARTAPHLRLFKHCRGPNTTDTTLMLCARGKYTHPTSIYLCRGDRARTAYLKEVAEDVGMRVLNLVEEDDTVRPLPDCLSQLTSFIVADVAWRTTDQPRDRMRLRKL